MADKSMNLNFYAKVQGDVSDVRSKIESIKTELKNLTLPNSVSTNFIGILSKLQQQLDDFESKSKGGIASPKDASRVASSWQKVTDQINKASLAMDKIANLDSLFDTATSQKIKATSEALENYQKALDGLKADKGYQALEKQNNTAIAALEKSQKTLKEQQKNYDDQQKKVAEKKEDWLTSPNKTSYEKAIADQEAWQEEVKSNQQLLEEQRRKMEEFQRQHSEIMNGKKIKVSYTDELKKKESLFSDTSEKSLSVLDDQIAREKEKAEELKGIWAKASTDYITAQQAAKDYKKSHKNDINKEEYASQVAALKQQEALAKMARDQAQKDYGNQDKLIHSLEERKGNLLGVDRTALQQEITEMKSFVQQAENLINEQTKLAEKKKALENDIRKKGPNKASQDQLAELEKEEETLRQMEKDLNEQRQKVMDNQSNQSQLQSQVDEQKVQATAAAVAKLKEAFSGLGISVEPAETQIADLQKILNNFIADAAKGSPQALQNMIKSLREMGIACKNVKGDLSQTGQEIKELSERQKDFDRMKFSILQFLSVGNAVRMFKRSVRDAINTVKDLDKAMTETAVVTNFSVADMWKELPRYTQTANDLGATTQGAYETMTLYYQQGLKTQQAFEVGTETMKMARIAGMDYAQATNLMTAALRGFNMEVNKDSATKINDTYSKLAAITAADTQEIATAMTKTASIANSAGMEFETTAAFLTQIIETTRESPETAGTAMKTVIARFQEMTKAPFEIGEVDGEKVDANKIETALKSVGVALRDNVTGQFRELDDVFIELASKWDGLDKNTQRYIATIAAGSRQQSRFLAMMSDFERTKELMDAAKNSKGASQEQFEKTLDSLEAKANKLKNAWHEFTMDIADSTSIKAGTDTLTSLLTIVNKMTGNSGLAKLGLVLTSLKIGRAGFQGLLGKGFGKSLKEEFSLFTNMSKTIVETEEQAGQSGTVLASQLGIVQKTGRSTLQIMSKVAGKFEKAQGMATSFGVAASSGLATTVAGLGAIALVLGAIWATYKLIENYQKNISAQGQLNNAKEVQKELAVGADEAKASYDKLNDTLDSLDQKYSNIENLTKGTQEWKEAVAETNKEVLNLISEMPKLSKAVEFKDGLAVIDEAKAKGVLEDYQDSADMQSQAAAIAKRQVWEKTDNLYFKEARKQAGWGKPSGVISKSYVSDTLAYVDVLEEETRTLGQKIAQGAIKDLAEANEWVQAHVGSDADLLNPADFEKIRNLGNQELEREEETEYLNSKAVNEILDDISISSEGSRDFISDLGKELTTQRYQKEIDTFLATLDKDKKGNYDLGADADAYRSQYAASRNWQHLSGTDYIDEKGQKVTAKDNQVAFFMAAQQAKNGYSAYAKNLDSLYSQMSAPIATILSQLLSETGTALTSKTLDNLSKFIFEGSAQSSEEFVGKKILDGDALAKSLGIEGINNLADLAKNFNMDPKDFSELLASNISEANERINDQRFDITKSLMNLGAFSKFSGEGSAIETYKALEDKAKEKYGETDTFRDAYQGVLTSLEQSGDKEFSKAFIEKINKEFGEGLDLKSLTDLSIFSSKLDFSKPLETVRLLKNAANDTTTAVGRMAQEMLKADLKSLSGSAQLKEFLQSPEYTDKIAKDLQEIADAEGDISAAEILDMADGCENLQQILDETSMSAESLAQALAMLADGTLTVNELTDTVLAAISTSGSLDSLVANTLKDIKDFDPGITEDDAAGFINDTFENLKDHLERGAYGNSQMDAYMDHLFGDTWDSGLSPENRITKLEATRDKLEKNTQFMRDLWDTAAQGLDFYGNSHIDDKGRLENFEKYGLKATNIDGNIVIDELTEGSLNTENLSKALQGILGISEAFAGLMITDFKNYDTQNMTATLNANDRQKGYSDAYEQIKNSDKIYDAREAAAIDKFYGVVNAADSFVAYMDSHSNGEILKTDLYDQDGILKQGAELFKELNKVASFMTKDEGYKNGSKQWGDQFLKDRDPVYKKGLFGGEHLVSEGGINFNYDEAKAQLASLGITGQDAANVIQQAFETQVENGAKNLKVQFTDAFGEIHDVAVKEGQTVEQAIAAEVKRTDFEGMANAIKKAFTGETKISFVANGTEEITSQLDAITQNAGKERKITLTSNASTVKAQIDGIVGHTVYIDVVKRESGSLGGAATGLKNAPRAGVALTGEKGPELVQTANSAYITGASGPEMAYVNKGDTIYTASETKKILKGNRNKKIFNAYSGGKLGLTRNSIGGYGGAGNGSQGGGSHRGGSGGGGKDNKPSEWKISLDMLYNLLRQIQEEERERNRIERRYEQEVKKIGTKTSELVRFSKEQLKQLNFEKKLQQELYSRRGAEMDAYLEKNQQFSQYAKVETNAYGERTVRIDWEAIDRIDDKDQSKKVEEYVKQLEEWSDEMADIEDTINDIDDQVAEIREKGKESYIELENRIKDALIQARQNEIDKLSEINSTISDGNSRIVSAMQDSLAKSRQDRENEKTEKNLREKYRKVAYLSQDTSGANALDVLALQKEIEEQEEDYTDTLIDQKIEELQKQNEQASEQREQQISIMTTQLHQYEKSAEIWEDAHRILEKSLDDENNLIYGSALVNLLKQTDNWHGMSAVQKMDWLEKLENQVSEGMSYLEISNTKQDELIDSIKQAVSTPQGSGPSTHYDPPSGGGGSGGNGGGGSSSSSGGHTSKTYTATQTAQSWYHSNGKLYYNNVTVTGTGTTYGEALSNASQKARQLTNSSLNAAKAAQRAWNPSHKLPGHNSDHISKYASGGLADFTGPAWLDGTKSRPEIVLNARDSKNFIQLRDILASIYSNPAQISSQKSGDNTYDIDIYVESIGNDYDVDQLAGKVESLINQKARYRNNNTIGIKR